MTKTSKGSIVSKKMAIAAKNNTRRVHVTSRSDGWAIKKEGKIKAYKVHSTQQDAINAAKKLVETGKASTVIIHGKDGRIRK